MSEAGEDRPARNAVDLVANLIHRHFGLDFRGARRDLLVEALAERGADVDRAARSLMGQTTVQLQRFVEGLVNGETYFLRHPAQLEALRIWVAAREAQTPGRPLRIWSAGCASGEEPLSLSITCLEALPLLDPSLISILATDLCGAALSRAREGRYSAWSFRSVPTEARDTHFVADGRHWRPRPLLRERLTYERHNLLRGPPQVETFDVVVCRNVLIYFEPGAQIRALEVLRDALRPGGLLVLGPAEAAARTPNGFAPIDIEGHLLFEREGGPNASPNSYGLPPATPKRRRTRKLHPPGAKTDAPSSQAPQENPREARLSRARNAADQGRSTEAKALASALLSEDPTNVEALLLLAVLEMDVGDADRAVSRLDQALTIEPDLTMAHYLGGLLLQSRGYPEPAGSCYQRALHTMVECPEDQSVRGSGGLTVGELTRSIEARLGAARRPRESEA